MGRYKRNGLNARGENMTTPMIEKILLCWSGGKDSAFALHELKKANQFEVALSLPP